MTDPTNDPAIPRTVFDLLIGAGGAVLGGVFAMGKKSEQFADHEKRIARLEQERHDDTEAVNTKIETVHTRIEAVRSEIRTDISGMRHEIREELKDIRSDIRDALRRRDD
jgi:archaellum component FlaC